MFILSNNLQLAHGKSPALKNLLIIKLPEEIFDPENSTGFPASFFAICLEQVISLLHGQRSLVGYSSWGCKESDTTERLTRSLSLSNN